MAKSNVMAFLKDFEKELESEEGIGGSSEPPRYWFSTGNYALNRIISGSYFKGIPQGRVVCLAGPSGTGKSYMTGNIIKNAQQDPTEGAFALVIDSENALDNDFMRNIGVKVDDKTQYDYKSVITIAHVVKTVSSFLKLYRNAYGDNLAAAPRVIIAIDSLDMLSTDAEHEHFTKGEQSSDQGLRAKQLKQMLRQFVQAIKDLNVSIVCTHQVYRAKAEQILAGEGVWIVNDAIRYALSQIILLKKLKLKNKEKTDVVGIRMIAEGFKTRFTRPFQTSEIEIPYETGIDALSGLAETLLSLKVIEKRGSRLAIVGTDTTFFEKDIAEHATELLTKGEALSNKFVKVVAEEDDEGEDESDETLKERRKARAAKGK